MIKFKKFISDVDQIGWVLDNSDGLGIDIWWSPSFDDNSPWFYITGSGSGEERQEWLYQVHTKQHGIGALLEGLEMDKVLSIIKAMPRDFIEEVRKDVISGVSSNSRAACIAAAKELIKMCRAGKTNFSLEKAKQVLLEATQLPLVILRETSQ